jgi:hypothetical protein
MCSSGDYGVLTGAESELAARLAAEIDEVAAAAGADAANPDVASLLARAWAMIAAADPDLAARAAEYRGS